MGDGSDVVEGSNLVNQTKEGELQVDNASPKENGLLQKEVGSAKVKREVINVNNGKKVSEGEVVEAESASCKQPNALSFSIHATPGSGWEQTSSPLKQVLTQKAKQAIVAKGTEVLEESRPISVSSSPDMVEALREEQGEVPTLDAPPKPTLPLRSSAEKSSSPTEVVEIIEEDVEEEGAITGFLERVPKVKPTNTSLSSIASPIYPPLQLFKRKAPAKKFYIKDTSSEDEEEDLGIISCNADTKYSVRKGGGKLASGKGPKKIQLEKNNRTGWL